MISFDCQCGKPFRFSLKFKGRQFRCNTCGRPLVVPEESEAALSVGKKQVVSVGSGEIITPVKPVLKIDLGTIPQSLQKPDLGPAPPPVEDIDDTPIQGVLVHSDADDTVGEDEDDEEIVISGHLEKIKENEFHLDLDIGEPVEQDKDSTSTILSKAVLSNVLKEQAESSAPAEEISVVSTKEKPAKRGGMLSGFFKKKPVVPNVIDLPPESPKSEPAPAKNKSKKRLPAPTPPPLEAVPDHDPKKTAQEKPAKTKPAAGGDSPSRVKKIVTTGLVFLGPILIVTLSVLLFMERGQTAVQRENVAKLKKDVENLNRRIGELQKAVEPQPVEEPKPLEEPQSQEEPKPVVEE